jgi:hypothetical protein
LTPASGCSRPAPGYVAPVARMIRNLKSPVFSRRLRATLWFCALLWPAALFAEGEGRKIFSENEKTVLILRTHFNEQNTGNGSAFIVQYKDRNFLITNYHVISSGYIFLEVGSQKIRELKVLRVNDTGDIAILTFPRINSFAAVPLEAYEPLRGEKVYAMGFPGVPGSSDVSLTITDGLVSNNRLILPQTGPTSRRFIQVSAALNPGNSGGPVFGEGGRLIGMATGGITNRQNMNLAIPAEDIISEIDQIEIRGGPDGARAKIAVTDRLELIAQSIRDQNIMQFGYYYSPEYKLKIFPDVQKKNERIYSAHRLMTSRSPATPDEALGIIRQYLEPEEFLYYLVLLGYFQNHPSEDFGEIMYEVSVNPFLGSQLYLSGRFLFLLHHLSEADQRKFEYTSHTVDRIEFDREFRTADVDLTVRSKNHSFPVKLRFTREWGNWFLMPVYDYSKLLRAK